VITVPPADYNVTGWRDTLVFRGTKAFHDAIGNHTRNTPLADISINAEEASNEEDEETNNIEASRSGSRSRSSSSSSSSSKRKSKSLRG
jgi:hypothetical protein